MNKEPLYRKDNKTAYGYRHNIPVGDYATQRQSKKTLENPVQHESMGGKKQRGMDYTPLFRFLISKAGQNWDLVFSEAKRRLDKEDPIFWLVALRENEKKPIVRIGGSACWSGLYVDEYNILRIVDPTLDINKMYPSCACCTHTFNGKVFPNRYDHQKYAWGYVGPI